MAKSTAERSAAHRRRLHERNMIRERVWVHPALTHLLRQILDAVRAYPEGTSQRIAIETALKSRHQAGIDPDGKIVIIDAVIWQNRSPPTTIDEVRQQSLAVTISTRKPSPTRRYKNYELRRFYFWTQSSLAYRHKRRDRTHQNPRRFDRSRRPIRQRSPRELRRPRKTPRTTATIPADRAHPRAP